MRRSRRANAPRAESDLVPLPSDADIRGETRLDPLAIGVACGVLAVVHGPAPTGQSVVDMLLVGILVTAVTWFGSVVPVRFAGAIVLAAGALSLTWPGLVLGAVTYVISARVAVERRFSQVASALLLGLALNLAARSDLEGFLGASTIVGVVLAVAILARAFPLRSRRARRTALVAIAVMLAVPIAAAGTLAATVRQSADDLLDGEEIVQRGLDQLSDGDIRQAQTSFELAAETFRTAHDRMANPLTRPAAAVPVAAQHRRAALEVSAQAARSSATLADQLELIDLDQLTFRNGRIDVRAIAGLADPLAVIEEDIGALRDTVVDVDGPWLVDPIRQRLGELADDIDAQLERTDDLVRVVQQVPAMLGAEGRRVYFVAFTTPAEARGLGGFMGNWAEFTIENGDIELTEFGRSDDLDDFASPGERKVTGPEDWLARYGRYGFTNGPVNGVGGDPWKNITMSASMSSTGQVMSELYPQSGGRDVDGVFVLDVFAVSALLEFTGPIELPDGQGVVTSENAPQFLLNGQYEETDTEQRIDVLEIVSNEVFDTLLGSDLPPARELLDVLGPLVEQGRLVGYAAAPREQEMLEQSGLAGTLTDPDGRDGLAITLNNAIGNKIDFFLRSSATYSVVADRETGTARADLDIVLDNRAPEFGQPNYVIGNPIGAPDGSNQTLVSVYSQLPAVEVQLDGTDVEFVEQTRESGYYVTGVFVELDSRESKTLSMRLAGTLDLVDGYQLVLRTPPTARQFPLDVDATLTTGDGDLDETWEVRRAGRHELSVGTIGE
jgi:hypothetical protein